MMVMSVFCGRSRISVRRIIVGRVGEDEEEEEEEGKEEEEKKEVGCCDGGGGGGIEGEMLAVRVRVGVGILYLFLLVGLLIRLAGRETPGWG